MEESNSEVPSVKKMKLDSDECSPKKEEIVVEEEPTKVTTFKSPVTNPMLHPETWAQIFRDFSGTDFLAVTNAAPQWNHLLGSRKTTELFPLVVPHILPYLKGSELLACRQVQRGSQAAVDKFVQTLWTSPEIIYNFDFGKPSVHGEIYTINMSYGLDSKLDIDRFYNALCLDEKARSYNPFLTRGLCMNLDVAGDAREARRLAAFHSRMSKLLFRFGTHVWRLNLHFDEVDHGGILKLTSYLNRLSQLKVLDLTGNTGRNMHSLGHVELPLLQNLNYLVVRGFRFHSVTSRLIERYGAQLTTLELQGSWIECSRIGRTAFKTILPKLRRLRVEGVSATVLEKLSDVDWPLENLHLRLNRGMSDKRELLLTTISNFRESLSTLELDLIRYFDDCLTKEEDLTCDPNELRSIQTREDEEAMFIIKSPFKRSTKLKQVVAYWETSMGERHKVKVFKIQEDCADDASQLKMIRSGFEFRLIPRYLEEQGPKAK